MHVLRCLAASTCLLSCGAGDGGPPQESGPGQTSGTSGDATSGDKGSSADTTGGDAEGTQGSTGDTNGSDGDDDSGGPPACVPAPPELAPITWNVLEGPVPPGTRPLSGDGSDERAAIQGIVDAAAPGDVVFLPNPPAFYGIADTVTISQSIEIRGLGFSEGSVRDGTAEFIGPRIEALNAMSPMVFVAADNVTVRGLGFVGPGRPVPPVTERWEFGIYANGTADARTRGLTVVDNDVRAFVGEGIKLRYVEGYIVRNNHVTEMGYAGITAQHANYGLLTGNRVTDVIGTEVGQDPYVVNAYGLVLSGTGAPDNPICDHTIMSDNYVQDIPGWTGVMDHGGQYTLMMDNHAEDCDFGLALTGPGSDCLVINNVNKNSPRQGFWNIGRARVGLIGNVFINADMFSLSGADMVITDNRSVDGIGTTIADNGSYGQLTAYEARNDWGAWTEWQEQSEPSIWLSGATTPAVPRSLEVTACDDQRSFRWDYDESEAHDGFVIEGSADGDFWEVVAYRPPHDGTWNFDTDLHPNWEPLDTLAYSTKSDALQFRIRALHADAVSEWSDVAMIE